MQYADYRNKWDRTIKERTCDYCELGSDGLCIDATLEPLQFHCIAQQCAFDYCTWSRDLYIEECNQAISEGERVIPDLPNWGDVYNYDELHGDYLLYYESNGVDGFTSPECVAYYDMYPKAEARYWGEDGSDDEDEDDDDMYGSGSEESGSEDEDSSEDEDE